MKEPQRIIKQSLLLLVFIIVISWVTRESRLLQQIGGTIFGVMLLIWLYTGVNHKKIEHKRYINKEVLPMFEKLEAFYGAQYITVIYDVRLPIKDLEYSDSKTAYIFVAKDAFHIVSSCRSELHIILPFSEIEEHACYVDGNYYDTSDYIFQIKSSKEEDWLVFKTIPSSLCKKDERFKGSELYRFITSNFPKETPQ